MDIIQSFEHTVVNQICHSLNIGSLENTSRVPLSGGGLEVHTTPSSLMFILLKPIPITIVDLYGS